MEEASLKKTEENLELLMKRTHLKEGEDYKVDGNVYDLEIEF